ncbi:MAG TPA: DUF6504 family protein [Yinghuangia sp.]|uniref:DUF6504 family protein n=1 Tax=Yinghuangia sp. YIM S10712 TaxID=3436930 RepID=UPI002B64DF68|nr:DUF6504 family protein [Yinghuangia sp.]
MARRHIDPVEVARSGGEPARFLWHDKLYVVRDILDHWVENEEWWHAAGRPAQSGRTGLMHGPDGSAEARRVAPGIGPGVSDGTPSGTALLAAEREVWRVEAAAGRSAPLGVFELRLDAHGSWTLARSLD